MAQSRINKSEVYSFLRKREIELLGEKLKPLNEKLEKIKKSIIDKTIKDTKIDKKKFIEDVAAASTTAAILRDSCDWNFGTISSLAHIGVALKTEEKLYNILGGAINFDKHPEYSSIVFKIKTQRGEIKDEFVKLNNMVKSLNTGNQAVRHLKELGFDTSSIEPSKPKNQLVTLNVNKSLLNLPDKK